MGKLVIFTVLAATAITAAAVPTTLLLGGEGKQLETTNKRPAWPAKLMPHLISARSVRSEHKKINCLTKYYGNTIIWNSEPLSDREFNDITNFSNNSKSCLLVEYHKQEYENGKWWGEFKLIWSVKDEINKRGLITVTSVRTQNGQLLGNSAAYVIKKSDSQEKWFVSYIKEVTESKKDAGALQRLIPQASSTLPESPGTTNYWGFSPDIQNICGKDDCTKTKGDETKKSYSWEFSGNEGGNEKLDSWTPDITKWLKDIFAWEALKNKIKDIKGKWQLAQNQSH